MCRGVCVPAGRRSPVAVGRRFAAVGSPVAVGSCGEGVSELVVERVGRGLRGEVLFAREMRGEDADYPWGGYCGPPWL
jgi:hypothetical protein